MTTYRPGPDPALQQPPPAGPSSLALGFTVTEPVVTDLPHGDIRCTFGSATSVVELIGPAYVVAGLLASAVEAIAHHVGAE